MTKESILYLLSSDHRPTRSIYDLSRSDIHSLLYRSDLSETDSHGMNVLMHTLSSNRYKNLNLSSEQWGYLIDNSNLKQMSVNGVSALYAYAKDHVYEKVVLSKTQQNCLFDGFFKEADLEDPKIKQTGDWLLDVVFMSQKNVDNLFTQNRIDYLIDHFNLKNFFFKL